VRSRRCVCVWTNPTRGRRRASNSSSGRPAATVSARTRASSSAIPAPSAMLGDIAWAASPTSTTRPRTHGRWATSSIGAKYGGSRGGQALSDDRGDRLGELAVLPGQLGRVAAGGVGRGRGVDVGVAVDRSPPSGTVRKAMPWPSRTVHAETRQRRPPGSASSPVPGTLARRPRTPRCGPRSARRRRPPRGHSRRPSHRRRPHGPAALIVQRGYGGAQADRDPLAQDLVEATAADGHARPSCTPHRRQVHLDQLAAAVIEEPLPGDHAGAAEQRCLQPERAQRPDRVGRQVHPRARL
jgi:hypothetical protein